MTEEQINYNQMRANRESLEFATTRIMELEMEIKELQQRLFEMTQAKMELTPLIKA